MSHGAHWQRIVHLLDHIWYTRWPQTNKIYSKCHRDDCLIDCIHFTYLRFVFIVNPTKHCATYSLSLRFWLRHIASILNCILFCSIVGKYICVILFHFLFHFVVSVFIWLRFYFTIFLCWNQWIHSTPKYIYTFKTSKRYKITAK